MAFNSSHWTIDYGAKTVTNNDSATGANLPSVTGNNDYVGSMLEFFQWLAGVAAQNAQMDDDYPIQSDTPTQFRWLNGWAFGHANDYKYLSGGDMYSSDGNELWANLYSIGTQEAGSLLYVIQNSAEITPWWTTGNLDILVHVMTGGSLIDSGNVRVMCREYGDTYDHFDVDLSGGRNVASINTEADKNNTTAAGTVALYGVTTTFGSISRDLNNGNGSKNYDVEVDCNGKTMLEVFEWTKWATQHNSSETLNGDAGEEYLAAGAYTPVKKSPFGEFAGGTFFGARGVWFTNYNGADFELTASDGTTQAPPNYQSVSVDNDNLSGCQILVSEHSGGAYIKNQYTLSSATTNSITMTGAIDQSKTPQSGVVRFDNTEYAYTGFSGSTLTGVTPDPSGESGDAYIPLLSVLADATTEVSDQIIQSGDIPVRIDVRKYGFKPYTKTGIFGANGFSDTPILTVDPQAT